LAETPPPDRPEGNLTRHTVSGLQWSYFSALAGGVLQFGMTAVMARLLSPTAFGLVALAGLFLRFVDYFAKAGIAQALVQKAQLSPTDIRAAFTISAGMSAVFALVAVWAAPLAGRLAQDPDLVPVLRWLALGLLLQGLGAPALALLRRRMAFKQVAILELSSYVLGYMIVGLALALAGAGVFALVAAMLTQLAFQTVAAYSLTRHPARPTLSLGSHRAIFGFGGRISVIGFFEFLQTNLDTLAIGRWAGSAQLGLYNRAKVMGELPSYHLTEGLRKVIFPSFSAIQADTARLRTVYISSVGLAASIVLPLNAGMAVAAPELIRVVLGPQWLDAIPVMPWVMLASTLTLFGWLAGTVLEAQAALNAKLLVAIGSTVTLVLLLFLAEGRPLAAYAAAVAAASLFMNVGYVGIMTRTLQTSFASLVLPFARGLAGAAIVAAAIALCRYALYAVGTPVLLVLIGEVIVGALALAFAMRVGPLDPFRKDLVQRLTAAGIMGSGASRADRLLTRALGSAE
jgi:lipopolysaccharide exporter